MNYEFEPQDYRSWSRTLRIGSIATKTIAIGCGLKLVETVHEYDESSIVRPIFIFGTIGFTSLWASAKFSIYREKLNALVSERENKTFE